MYSAYILSVLIVNNYEQIVDQRDTLQQYYNIIVRETLVNKDKIANKKYDLVKVLVLFVSQLSNLNNISNSENKANPNNRIFS